MDRYLLAQLDDIFDIKDHTVLTFRTGPAAVGQVLKVGGNLVVRIGDQEFIHAIRRMEFYGPKQEYQVYEDDALGIAVDKCDLVQLFAKDRKGQVFLSQTNMGV